MRTRRLTGAPLAAVLFMSLLASTSLLAQTGTAPVVPPVALPATDQARLGVATTPLVATQMPMGEAATIRVLDPSPLALLEAGIAAAAAAEQASARDLERLQLLAGQDQSASQQAVETALARSAADKAQLDLMQQRLWLEWGPALAQLAPGARNALVAQLAHGDAVLLRADAPQQASGILGAVALTATPGGAVVTAQPLGFAPTTDPRMQTVGVLAVVRGPQAQSFKPGSVFSGEIQTGAKTPGVIIRRSAIVRLDGTDWAYVQTDPETFERREIVDPKPVQEGWFVTIGFAAGEPLVTQGAGSLVAVERADEAAEVD